MGFLSPADLDVEVDEEIAWLLTTVVYFHNMKAKATRNTPAAAPRIMFVVLTGEEVDPLLLVPLLGGTGTGTGQAEVRTQLL